MITLEEVRERIAIIRREAGRGDDELAHCLEDALFSDVLIAIADGSPDSRALAVEALKTRHVDFDRWCA